MYGSASSSVPTSRISSSCRVVGVDGHVLVREVGEEHLGLGALAREGDLVLDLHALHRPRERGLVVGDRRPGGADLDALDGDVHSEWRGGGRARERGADRLDDPPPSRRAPSAAASSTFPPSKPSPSTSSATSAPRWSASPRPPSPKA